MNRIHTLSQCMIEHTRPAENRLSQDHVSQLSGCLITLVAIFVTHWINYKDYNSFCSELSNGQGSATADMAGIGFCSELSNGQGSATAAMAGIGFCSELPNVQGSATADMAGVGFHVIGVSEYKIHQ